VSEFIDASTGTWKEEDLRIFMLPMDVDHVLQIPICSRRYDDSWAWHYDGKGIFTVRSAYKMWIVTRDRREAWLENRASASNSEVVEK
jgi:hypothetical protein